MTPRLCTRDLTYSYGGAPVLNGITLDIPDQQITAVIGPNACGKSTLLKCLARLLRPQSGSVLLDGTSITRQKTRAVARSVALLPQSAEAPEGMRVADLVARGRTPHQSPMQQWSQRDASIVAEALSQVGLSDLADQELSRLSGGQRQRAWIAMVLAQETDILLLDEPTTFLDMRFQIDTLKRVEKLQKDRGLTVVMVLHDINLAARFAAHIVALRNGEIICQGAPETVVTEANVHAIYNLATQIMPGPVSGAPYVIPL